MDINWYLEWYNALYTLPLAAALLVLALGALVGLVGGAFAGLTHSHAEHADLDAGHGVAAGHDAGLAHGDHGHDAEFDHHLDLDAHAGVPHAGDAHGHSHDHGPGHQHDHGCAHADPGLLVSALAAIGAGRAPLMLLLQVLVLLWGLTGLFLHQAFSAAGPAALIWSVPAALLASVLGTRSFALLFGRFIQQHESSAVRRDQIVGRTGRVVYPVSEGEGTVSVRDEHGTLHRVRARSHHGALDSGREIIVIGYDADQKVYQVDDASTFVDRI